MKGKIIKVILILFSIRFLLVVLYNSLLLDLTVLNLCLFTSLYALRTILEYLYVYVIATCDLHEFEPKIILRQNDKLELVAIGLNGNEMFKFTIDKVMLQSHPNPL